MPFTDGFAGENMIVLKFTHFVTFTSLSVSGYMLETAQCPMWRTSRHKKG
jgi:hypothetical protein